MKSKMYHKAAGWPACHPGPAWSWRYLPQGPDSTASWWTDQRRSGTGQVHGQTHALQLWTSLWCHHHLRWSEREMSASYVTWAGWSVQITGYCKSLSKWKYLQTFTVSLQTDDTSISPDLMIIKVSVTSDVTPRGEESVGQGATLPVKRVPIVVHQAGKRHSDVPFRPRPPAVNSKSIESQGGRVAPGSEGVRQDVVHQTSVQGGWDGARRVTVDTADKNRFD